MADTSITIGTEPDESAGVRQAVLAGLNAFNNQHVGPADYSPLTVAARNGAGDIVGGLVGEIRASWKWLSTNLLWVAESHRGQGVGRQLLRAAEAEALRRGCKHAYVDTFDFQARGFYEKAGYAVFGEQDDYPPGHRRFFLRKPLQ